MLCLAAACQGMRGTVILQSPEDIPDYLISIILAAEFCPTYSYLPIACCLIHLFSCFMKKANLASIGEVLAAQRRATQPSNARSKTAKSRPAQTLNHPDAASPQK